MNVHVHIKMHCLMTNFFLYQYKIQIQHRSYLKKKSFIKKKYRKKGLYQFCVTNTN